MKKSIFQLKAPICLGLITTNRCNLKCQHCMNSATTEYTTDELSTIEIKDIIVQACEGDIRYIEFNGGEFFVRNDVEELLDFAIEKNIKIAITTNGTLISDDWIKKYQNKISLIRISLDSHIEEIHDSFRGVIGAFKKTVETIKKLKEYNYSVTILTTITKFRIDSFNEFLDFLANIGVNGLHTTLLIPAGRGADLVDAALTPLEHKEFLEKYREYKEKYISDSKLSLLEESPQTCLLDCFNSIDKSVDMKCGAAFTEMVVLNDGYVLPCASFIAVREQYQFEDLNIRNRKLLDIYSNSALMNKVRNINQLKGKCSKCEYLKACGGGCRASANIIYNDIEAEDPMCWYGEC